MADFPSSGKALDLLNTLGRTLANGNATSGTSLIVTAGDGIVGEDSTSGPAGDVNIAGGDNTGGASGDLGGGVILSGGSGNAGDGGPVSAIAGDSTSGAGGNVVLTPGTGATNDGLVTITRSGIQFVETATVPGPSITSGQGRLWLQTGAPNSLVFTNENGVDITLGSGGGALAGSAGMIYEDAQFYVDAGDRNSYPSTGTAVSDLIASLSGTLTGTSFADGAWRFDGATGALSFTKGASLHNIFDGGGTVIAIARPFTAGEGSNAILATTMASGINTGWRIAVRDPSSNRLGIEFEQSFTSTDGTWRTLDQTSREDTEPLSGFTGVRPWAFGSALALAVVYDNSATGNHPTFYLNGRAWTTTLGIQQMSAPVGTRDDDTANALTIGNEPGDTRTWDGDIASVILFDRALSPEEIAQVQQVLAQRYGIGSIGRSTDTNNLYGQNIVIEAGRATGSGSEDRGGSISIIGGESDSISFAAAGDVLVRGGHKRGGGNSRGGTLTLASGEGELEAQVQIYAGNQTSGNTGTATSVFIHGMDTAAGFTGTPGGVTVRGGNASESGSNRGGGDLILEGGGGDANPGGDVVVRSGGQVGSNTGGTTGSILIETDRNGTGGTGTSTGSITIQTTGGGATSTSAGDISITAGSTDAVTGNDPGSVTITAGSMNRSGQSFVGGRNVTLNAGASAGNSTANGGSIVGNAGNYTGGGSSTGGDCTFTAGDANGSGRAGSIFLTAGTNSGAGADGQIVITGELVNAAAATLRAADGSSAAGEVATLSAGTGDTGFDGGNLVLAAGDEGSGGSRGVVELQTNTVEPQPSASIEFAMIIPIPASGDGNDFRIAAAGGFTTGDSGGNTVIEAGATGGGGGSDGNVDLRGGTVLINDQSVSATTGGFLEAGSFDVKLEGKTATAASGNAGHSVTLQGGVGDGAGNGGDLVLAPGADGGTGTDGVIRYVNPADTALETTASWSPGNFGWLAPSGQAATDDGTSLFLTAGDGNTTGAAGTIDITAGGAGTDAAGGDVNITGGAGVGSENNGGGINLLGGGASDGNGGIIDIEGGPGTGTSRQGGLVRIQGGTPGTNATGGAVQLLGRAGNGTGAGGSITLTAANSGSGATGNGGQILGNAGDASSTNGNGGDITWAAGDGNGTGTNGRVILLTSGTDAPVRIRTTSGFSGTELDTFTFGSQTVIGTTSNSDIVTLATLDTNGQNVKIDVYITGVDNAADGEVNSTTIRVSYYRSSGTVTALGTHISDTQISNVAGGTFSSDITYSLVVSGNDILLRVTNGSGTSSYTGNYAVRWSIQEGGFSS